jgi:Spy/CpxP family protein refolding chaperone
MTTALKWKLVAGFLLVFVAGGVTGGYLAMTARNYFFGPGHHAVSAQRMRERLKSELNLTPDQVTKISPIIDKAVGQLQEIRMDTAGRVRETFAETHRQISANLTPEQQAKYNELAERHHRMMRRFHHPEGPPPSPSK